MSIQLEDFRYFAGLKEKLNRLTPEDIAAVERGLPFPTEEPVVGVLPDAAIALLALYQQATSAKHAAVSRYLDTDPHTDTDGSVRHAVIDTHRELMFLGYIIREVIKAEFPEVKRWRSFAYGPNFEVHHVTPSSIDGDFVDTQLAEILGGNTLDFARRK